MAQEGQTATNPNTGERVIFQGGAWQPLGGSAPTALPVFRSPMSPQQMASEVRAERSADRQDAAAIRAAEASDRAAAAAERAAATDARKAAAEERKLAAGGGIDATESERTAAFLATRVANGLETLKGIGSGGDATLGTRIAENLPFGLGNYAISEDRQRAATAQLDVLDAALTLGTGAAYTKEQLEGYRQSYFPQPGDGDDVIADKQSRLKVLLEAARVKAGAAAPAIDRALGNAQTSNTGVAIGARDNGFSLSPENEQKLLSFAPEASSPAEIVAFARGLGVNIPQEEAQRAFDYYRQGGRETAQISYGAANRALAGERDTAGGAIDAAVRGAADTLTLGFADEIAAAGDTVFGSGTMAENLARQRAIDANDEEVNPYARLGGQIAGGFGLPTGGATGARGLARIGALYGAGYGAGSADGSATDRLIGAAQGSVVGGATGGVLGALGSRLASRGGGGGSGGGGASDLMQAAQRQGVDVLPADVGGPMTRRFTAGVAQSPFGGGQITRAAQARDAQFAERIGQIAAQEGAPVRQEVLGDTARTAAERYIANTAAEGRRLYEGAREMSQGVQITPTNALSSIDNQLAELAPTASTDAPVIGALNTLREDLARGEAISVDAIRRLRTSTRAQAQSEGLRGSDYQRRAGEVLNSLSEDIASQLPPEAAQAFRQADQAWAARLDTIDNTMNAILGPRNDRSAEMVANRLSQMARGDSARLRTFVDSLNPEDAGIVRGSLISDLGRATSGQQGAAGTEFSLNTFLTNWDKLPERTRNILFRGESRAAIEDLARIAEGARGTSRYSNTSNTGGAGSVLSALGSIGTMGASAVAENLTGRLLASPRFARWLARPPRDPARAIRRLEQIAVRDPSIQPDISRIVQALEAGPNRAAAQEEQQ